MPSLSSDYAITGTSHAIVTNLIAEGAIQFSVFTDSIRRSSRARANTRSCDGIGPADSSTLQLRQEKRQMQARTRTDEALCGIYERERGTNRPAAVNVVTD